MVEPKEAGRFQSKVTVSELEGEGMGIGYAFWIGFVVGFVAALYLVVVIDKILFIRMMRKGERG
jgi:hypothetical protein